MFIAVIDGSKLIGFIIQIVFQMYKLTWLVQYAVPSFFLLYILAYLV